MALSITSLSSGDLLEPTSRNNINTNFSNIKTDLDNLSDNLENLTDAEVLQLENINLVTISNTQWGYLGAMSGQPLEDLTGKTTDNLSEGTSNLYFTTGRIDSHLSSGTGIGYSAGTISFNGNMSNLSDANITTPAAGQIPIYNATASEFENAGITGGTGISITGGDASATIAIDATVLQNVVEDTTPQLGGNLDLNTNNIVDAGANIILSSNGLGRIDNIARIQHDIDVDSVMMRDAVDVTSSGSLYLKTGRLDSLPDSATDCFVTIGNAGAAGVSPGDLVVIPRSGYSFKVFTGSGVPTEAMGIDSSQNATFAGVADIASGVKLGASDNYALAGDTTNSTQVLRRVQLSIKDGTNANTLECTVASLWNGDTISATDNINKGATTGDFYLSGNGESLRIETSGLTGNAASVIGTDISFNRSGKTLGVYSIVESGYILVKLLEWGSGIGDYQDMTSLVDTGIIYINIAYITDN